MDRFEESELDKILRLAAGEPAHRPQFCEVLMRSEVFLLGSTEKSGMGGVVNLEAGNRVQIQHWQKPDGSAVIPFFSSLEVLKDSIEAEESYLALPARSLFEITLGATLVLNPRSNYGKEFVPEEVEHLLSMGVSRVPSRRVVEKETEVLLGQPAHYPTKMIDSLTQFFAKHTDVKKAYLALMHDTSIDEKPHLIIGIETEGDAEKIIREAGNVAGDTAPSSNRGLSLARHNVSCAGWPT